MESREATGNASRPEMHGLQAMAALPHEKNVTPAAAINTEFIIEAVVGWQGNCSSEQLHRKQPRVNDCKAEGPLTRTEYSETPIILPTRTRCHEDTPGNWREQRLSVERKLDNIMGDTGTRSVHSSHQEAINQPCCDRPACLEQGQVSIRLDGVCTQERINASAAIGPPGSE
jgi:hypothetical protein